MQLSKGKIMINLIFWGWIVFPLAIKASNDTENLVRHKRDDLPGILTITYEDNSEIKTVFLLRIINTLATLKTPVYTTKYDPLYIYPRQFHCNSAPMKYYLSPYSIEKVGDPIFYHGVDSLSALTLFDFDRTLHGVIDEKFYIDGLPLSQAGDRDVVKNYMHLISNDIVPRMKDMTNKVNNNLNPEPSSSSATECSDNLFGINPNDYPINTLYPEILVGIETLSPMPLKYHEFREVYKYVLAYWNVVDMLFKNLKTINIRINIAAIVMGTDSLSFPFIHENRDGVTKDGVNRILKKNALNDLGKHFYKFLDKLEPIVRSPAECGGKHEREIQRHSITNRAIIVHDGKFAEFQTAARALTLLMVPPENKHRMGHRESCCKVDSSILNECCEIQLRIYARSRYSCCLLNYPRSLPLPEPRVVVTRTQQCLCYGYLPGDETNMDMYDTWLYMIHSYCWLPLMCTNENNVNIEVASKVLDGTPCDNGKFCHANYCV
ncbi:hypothetical protein PV327_009850 [Microctonus hyperodae]|uniref:Uncharacterized protein n=1 Tax=Microctonus hyperodae TaxID=165561 RepID=A0AA39F1T6_MICHY|nr:hypothetical protein PV327_009850 [Microctonus hyperodae]